MLLGQYKCRHRAGVERCLGQFDAHHRVGVSALQFDGHTRFGIAHILSAHGRNNLGVGCSYRQYGRRKEGASKLVYQFVVVGKRALSYATHQHGQAEHNRRYAPQQFASLYSNFQSCHSTTQLYLPKRLVPNTNRAPLPEWLTTRSRNGRACRHALAAHGHCPLCRAGA